MNTPTAMGNTIFHKLSSVRAIGPAGSIALCGSPLVAQPARTTASNTIHASQRRRLAAAVGPVAADLIGVGSRGCAAALKLPLIAELRGSWFRETRGGPSAKYLSSSLARVAVYVVERWRAWTPLHLSGGLRLV